MYKGLHKNITIIESSLPLGTDLNLAAFLNIKHKSFWINFFKNNDFLASDIKVLGKI